MGDYEGAMKYVETELENNDDSEWTYFYYGLLHKNKGNDEMADKALLKAVELTIDKQIVIPDLEVMMKADTSNIEYYKKYKKLIMDM